MAQGLRVVVYPVHDIEAAKKLYSTLLGVEPYVDTPYYVGFHVGDTEVGLNPHGHSQGATAPVAFFYVDDIAASIEALTAAGAKVTSEPQDVGGGMLVATVVDSEGNATGLTQGPA